MTPYLLIRKIKIQNANAMSSPITIGFPAMTAWLGGAHALERRLRQRPEWADLRFSRLAVSCHEYNLQTYRGRGDYEHSVIITANPLVKGSSGWTRPSFIEEGRIHLTVSLLLELQSSSLDANNSHKLVTAVSEALAQMKLASGDILDFDPTMEVVFISEGDAQTERRMLRKLMPGYVLIERRDLMEKAMADGTNSLEALLHFLEIRYQAETSKDSEIIKWKAKKEPKGWIVPIAVGFKGLSPLERVDRQRDADTPHRFAESLITLGEFKMPHHFANLTDILWQYEYHPEQNFYLCTNQPTQS